LCAADFTKSPKRNRGKRDIPRLRLYGTFATDRRKRNLKTLSGHL
jgi:hypothetical protein